MPKNPTPWKSLLAILSVLAVIAGVSWLTSKPKEGLERNKDEEDKPTRM